MKLKRARIFKHKSNGIYVLSLCLSLVFTTHLIHKKTSNRQEPNLKLLAKLDSIVNTWNKSNTVYLDTTQFVSKKTTHVINSSQIPQESKNPTKSTKLKGIILDSIPDIDLNTATRDELKLLPGIGDVLSKRIISFRDKLGGFISIEQCKLTYGLPPETFDKIKHRLTIESKHNLIHINSADSAALANHLYIMPWMASKIIRHRNWNGNYTDLTDFSSRLKFYPETIEKLGPYLQFE